MHKGGGLGSHVDETRLDMEGWVIGLLLVRILELEAREDSATGVVEVSSISTWMASKALLPVSAQTFCQESSSHFATKW